MKTKMKFSNRIGNSRPLLTGATEIGTWQSKFRASWRS
jgi:hypothetical protein